MSPMMMAQRVPTGNYAVGAASPGWSSSGVIGRNLFNKIKWIEHLICLKILREDLNITEGKFGV